MILISSLKMDKRRLVKLREVGRFAFLMFGLSLVVVFLPVLLFFEGVFYYPFKLAVVTCLCWIIFYTLGVC